MPRVSAKRKAVSGAKCQNNLKTWRQDETEQRAPPAQPSFSSLHSNVSSASYRHSLLLREERETHQTREDSTLIMTSLQIIKTLLSLVKCECGNQVTSEVTSEYFDRTVNLRCK